MKHELIEIDSPAAHACASPSIERWDVLEPLSGRWSWLTVFTCCGQVHHEPAADRPASEPPEKVRRAA